MVNLFKSDILQGLFTSLQDLGTWLFTPVTIGDLEIMPIWIVSTGLVVVISASFLIRAIIGSIT